jgi:hypothetical protein
MVPHRLKDPCDGLLFTDSLDFARAGAREVKAVQLPTDKDLTAYEYVDDQVLGAGVVTSVRVAPADVLVRESYRILRDEPLPGLEESRLASMAPIREGLLSGRLRGLLWDVVEVQLDIGVTLEMPPDALRKIAVELQP